MTEIVDNYTMFAVCEDVSECISSVSILLIPTCFCLIVFLLLLYIFCCCYFIYIFCLFLDYIYIFLCVYVWLGGVVVAGRCCLPVISLIN